MKFKVIAIIIVCITLASVYFIKHKTPVKIYQIKMTSVKAASISTPTNPEKTLATSSATTLHLPILMYHHIGYVPTGIVDSIRIGLTVSPENFTEQVNYLKQNGYTTISLNDLYRYTQHQFNLPKKPVLFTFDDGYDDSFQYAIPTLLEAGYTGTFAIITDFPGTVDGTNSYAAWDQILAAKNSGMEVVCHTQNHFDGSNPKFNGDYILQILTGCQQALTQHLGLAEPFVIYPYGHYSQVYLEQMKKLGLVIGLTVHEGSWINLSSMLELTRVRVNRDEPMDIFIEKLNN